jgi:hypothetical protein
MQSEDEDQLMNGLFMSCDINVPLSFSTSGRNSTLNTNLGSKERTMLS